MRQRGRTVSKYSHRRDNCSFQKIFEGIHSLMVSTQQARGIAMKLGITGLGRAGKTTVFNALTRRSGESVPTGGQVVPALGVVPVPDQRLDWLSALYHPRKTTHAQITYMDLQGVPGMADNKREYMSFLLTHMRPMDALIMVVRNFADLASGDPDPARDFRELEDEFLIADMGSVEKRLEKLDAELKRGKKPTGSEKQLLEECGETLNAGAAPSNTPATCQRPRAEGLHLPFRKTSAGDSEQFG